MDAESTEWKTVSNKRKNHRHSFKMKKRNVPQDGITTEEFIKFADIDSHTNLFKLQLEDLLKNINQEREDINMWLIEFREVISKIPESSLCSINDYPTSKKVHIPISLQPKNDKGCFKFAPPSKISFVGSYILNTVCSSTPVIDIAIEIPKICWQGMDHLNYRYHRKRALYLTYLAEQLLISDFPYNMEFTYQNDCDIKPNLLIYPRGETNFTLCVTAYPCEEAFKDNRFLENKMNIRSVWLHNDPNAEDKPTPFYNNSVLMDLAMQKLNFFLKEKLSSQSLKEAVILLKIWASKRGLTSGLGKLNGFILAMFVVSLLNKKRVSVHMNCYEIFKCAVLELSVASLSCDFFKEITNVNILYSVGKETLLMVNHEAKLALIIFDNLTAESFNNLFLKNISFLEKFEYLLHLENIQLNILPNICEKLKKGLGKRLLLLDTIRKSSNSWTLSSPPPTTNGNSITIGFLLNPDFPVSNLEKGPVANDPESKSFREFWGNQSELRRFLDGSVREAVFWPASTVADKRKVFCTMLKDIIERHFGIQRDKISVTGIETERVLQIPDIILSKDFPSYGTGEEAHTKIIQSFDSLCKQIRSLDLPLSITSVQGTSSCFRFSEIFPPLSVLHEVDTSKCYVDGHVMKLKNKVIGVPPYLPALNGIINFEGSGKWPNDVEAIQKVKTAFHIKIAALVKSKLSLMAVPFTTHVDIFKDGYIFRLKVACHKEIFILKQIKAPDGSVKIKETRESHDLEVSTQILPKLTSLLHGLHQQHNSYGTACRLAKRWIASQLKQGFIHDITIELILAFIYVHPEPYTCPCTPQVAFIRFLSLLVTHNWMASPLIINLNNEFKMENIEEINATFTTQRSTFPAMAIVTPYDKKGNMFTKNMPPEIILKRIILLAEASLDALSTAFLKDQFMDIKDIFRPPLDSFDVILNLKRKEIPKLHYALDVRINDSLPLYSSYECKANELYPVVEFDPVQNFVEELKLNFGDWAVFLNDPYGGDLIALKWKSAAFKTENAKVHHGCKIIPNVDEILESVRILGSGLIREIECKTHNWQLP